MEGVKIGYYHTWKYFGLYLKKFYVSPPAVKTYNVEIPGRDGVIDLTDVVNAGEIKYQNRTMKMEFQMVDGNYETMLVKSRKILNEWHGKKLKIIADFEPNYYYLGRISVDISKVNSMISNVVLTVDAEPYKCEITDSTEAWLWDSFCFQDSVIRTLGIININKSEIDINIQKGYSTVVPIFTVTGASSLVLSTSGKQYTLKNGINRFPDIKVGGYFDTPITIKGTGNVEIKYRARAL